MKTGEKIAKARKNANYTQDQLAERLGVSRQTVSKWESNLVLPETAKIAALSEALGVSCDALLREDCEGCGVVSSTAEGYTVDWSKLYPVLAAYPNVVDCEAYSRRFRQMFREAMEQYHYSLEDAVLVLKDLLYQTYLKLLEPEKEQ